MNVQEQLATLSNIQTVERFEEKLKDTDQYPLKAAKIEILQINVGRRCNLSCRHCHVEAGPDRIEIMPKDIFEKCLEAVAKSKTISTIDITGGSPEMNPNLEWFVKAVAKHNRRLIVRSNLVILLEEEYKKFMDIYAENKVEVVGSLPDYQEEVTNRQKGAGFFEKSIKVLQMLDQRGYGKTLTLDLVYNPVGAYLPGNQKALEHEYKSRLKDRYGVEFNNLFCLTNMPIGRFLEYLLKTDNYEDYMEELANAHNPGAVPNVMCRSTISVGWDGALYDCDFNQMLGLPIIDPDYNRIEKFDEEKLEERRIVIQNHCYGCTAGSGSSCQGALEL